MRFFRFLFVLPLCLGLVACHRPARVVSVETSSQLIDSSLDAEQDTAYLRELAPCKAALEQEMKQQLGEAPATLWVGQPECPMLNWASDALLSSARRVYDGRVDFAVVNVGGMRCEWPAGVVTRQSVFELMPFDNRLVILTLRGSDVLDLCQSFAEQGGQGVAGLRMSAEDGQLISVEVGGRAVEPDSIYYVATSNYLATGADHMDALTRASRVEDTYALIRDLYMEEVELQHTVVAAVDGRMNVYNVQTH